MFEHGFCKPLMVVNCAVPDELDLWYSRDSLEIRMEDRLFRAFSLVVSVAIALRLRIERLYIRIL